MFTVSMTDLSSTRRNKILLMTLIFTCAIGYLNLLTHYSGRINNYTFELSLIFQVKNSYYSMLNSMNISYNVDLDAYICNVIFTDILNIYDETHSKYNHVERTLITRQKLSISSMEKVRRDTIRKLGDMAAMEYPLDIDIKHQTKQGIMDKLKFTSPISNLSIQYELNPSSLCNGVDPYILILIKSAVKHHYLRYILRNTWIKEIYRTFPSAKVAFLLGYSHKERLIVWSENQVSGDIIQGNFTDAYRNNTFKTFMAFQWVERFCSKAKFIFFVDDDMFVNVKLMEKYLRTKSITNETDLLSGMIVKGGLPAREDLSPWYIGKEDYPFLLYPPYLAGCAMILSQSAVRKIAAVFPYVKYFPFDDVLLGIIMNKLGMDIEQNEYLYNIHVNNVTVLHKMMANHGFRDDEFLSKIYNGYSEKFLLKDKRLFL